MGNVNGNVTTLNDENGVQREYRQVKRQAKVGERIQSLIDDGKRGTDSDFNVGDVFTVTELTAPMSSGHVGAIFVNKRGGTGRAFYTLDKYVVLEPTDVVGIDGVLYTTVKRIANVGERIIVTSVSCGRWYSVGEVATVTNIVGRNAWADFKGGNWAIGHSVDDNNRYDVLEPVITESPESHPTRQALDQLVTALASLAADNVAMKKRLASVEMNVAGHERSIGNTAFDVKQQQIDIVQRVIIQDGILTDAAALKKRVAWLESLVNDDDDKSPSDGVFRSTPKQRQAARERLATPKLTRQDVIERAKRDVTELIRTKQSIGTVPTLDGGMMSFYPVGCGKGLTPTDEAVFTVDRDNRTVVAEIRWICDKIVWARGTASCAPDDVFNVHIGKAIALCRALGLDVPAEYTSAAKPTTVGVGDIVTFKDGYPAFYRVDSLDESGTNCTILRAKCRHQEGDTAYGGDYSWARIVDDSRESAAPHTEVAA